MLRDFSLSDSALRELRRLQVGKGGEIRVPVLYWARSLIVTSRARIRYRGESLCVGLYSRAKLDKAGTKIIEIDGIELVIKPRWHDRLEGKTLDFRDGRFNLEETTSAPTR